jgi:hypothetical protein
MDEGEGASCLERLWNDPAADASRHEAAEAIRRRYYDPDRNRRVMASVLDALVPPLPGRGG